MKIEEIKLIIIPDSRGKDTLEATLRSGNLKASASVPSGKSTGATEVAVLPPNQALDKVPWILSQIKDHQFASLDQFDGLLITLDGTPNKSNLGGNLILALSMAFARLLAKSANLELYELLAKISGTKEINKFVAGAIKMPFCFFNLIEGGIHADPPAGGLPFQEYLLIPQTDSPKISLEIVSKAIKFLEEKIQKEYGQVKQGDEGGFAIPSQDPEAGLKILQNISLARPGFVKLGLDVAASTFYHDGNYMVSDKLMSKDELLSYYQLLTTNYQLLSIEDPFNEEDWEGFSRLTAQTGDKVWIIGDDLLTTNVSRIKLANDKGAVNAVLIKPNQIGTITETIQAARLAKSYGWKIIVSHRSGETMDTFIADLAVGLSADGFKSGCPLQQERLVKYQRLIEIESILNSE